MSKTAIDAERGRTSFKMKSLEICLVGGDGPNDIPGAGHELWDPDVGDPVNMGMVASLRMRKQEQPIELRKYPGGVVACKIGRTRLKAIRYINEVDGLFGTKNELLVECFVENNKTTPQQAEEDKIIENAHRRIVSAYSVAQTAQAYLERHAVTDADGNYDRETMARCAVANNVTVPRLKQILSILEKGSSELHKVLRNDRSIGVQAALALVSLPPEEQNRKIAEARETGNRITTHRAQAAAREARGVRTAPTKKEIKSQIEKLVADRELLIAIDPVEVLQWIVGEADCPDWRFKKAGR